jgi:hypothetical protein
MLDDLAAVTRRQAEAKGLAFDTQFGDDLPERVRTDARRCARCCRTCSTTPSSTPTPAAWA